MLSIINPMEADMKFIIMKDNNSGAFMLKYNAIDKHAKPF